MRRLLIKALKDQPDDKGFTLLPVSAANQDTIIHAGSISIYLFCLC